jgi:hypothetical protein
LHVVPFLELCPELLVRRRLGLCVPHEENFQTASETKIIIISIHGTENLLSEVVFAPPLNLSTLNSSSPSELV